MLHRILPLLAVSILVSAAVGASMDGIGAAVGRITVLQAGVLLLPLTAEAPGTDWPATVELRFEDGEALPAEVVWIHRRPWSPRRRWTDDASGLAVRPIQAADDSATPADGGAPFAIVQVPPGRGGDFTVVDPRPGRRSTQQPVRPAWIERQSIDASWNTLAMAAQTVAAGAESAQGTVGEGAGGGGDRGSSIGGARPTEEPPTARRRALERRQDLALPDPASPFEHFRWVLMAHRMELESPPPPGEGVVALLAQHGAEMWSIGLGRLAVQSPGVAAACADALTGTALDGERRIAAWVTDWVETNALLAILLDPNKRDRAVLDAALGWAESREPLLLWPQQDQGSIVAVAGLNTLVRDVTLNGVWAGAETNPAARTIRGGELGSVNFARPPLLADDPLQRRDPRRVPLSLLLEFEGRRRTIPVGPAVTDATPPGVPLPQFRPALRLSEARSGLQEAVPASRATAGILRKSRGRWEVFVECGRPPRTDDRPVGGGGPALADDAAPEVSVPRERGLPLGREALVLLVGPRERPRAMLAIPEEGEPWLIRGPGEGLPSDGRVTEDDAGALAPSALPADLEVHRRSLPTVWRCRIVLPAEWLPPAPIDDAERPALLLGMSRTHGGDEAVENAGLPQVPWDPWPAPIAIGLDRWEE